MNNGPAMASSQTTTITETHVQTNIRWDPSYIKTIPGGLKVAGIIINLVVFICVMSSGVHFRELTTAEWTDFVAMTAFWVTGILLIFYLLHVIEKFHVIPWMTIEMGFTILWAFFYLTCSIDLAINAKKYGNNAFAAASFFGFVAMGVYGFDGFLKFKGWKAGQIAQGERVVQQAETATY